MKFLAAAGLAGACLATSPLLAADLFETAPPPMDAPLQQQAELGTNWYIRGDVGYGVINQATIQPNGSLFPTVRQGGYFNPANTFVPVAGAMFNSAPTGNPTGNSGFVSANSKSAQSASIGGGVGYRINDWLRVEGTYAAFRGPGLSANASAQCVNGLTPVSNYNATTNTYVPFGNTVQSFTCGGVLNASQFNQTGMATAYIDIGHWGIFNPFVGAGVGVNANYVSGSMNWYNPVTGAAYNGTPGGAPPYQLAVATGQKDVNGQIIYAPLVDSTGKSANGLYLSQNWNRKFSSWKFDFAGQLVAGVGFQISQSATMDLTYKIMSLNVGGGANNLSQSLSLGVRYNLN